MTSVTMVSNRPNAQLGFNGARHLVPDRLPSASGERPVVLRALYIDDEVTHNIRRMASHLRQIDLSDLNLSKLDQSLVENLIELQSLNVSDNLLGDSGIPAVISKLDRLIEFVGHNNSFTKIPKPLSKLKHLRRLMMANNRMDSLEGVEKFHWLQLLVADDNKIRELPRDIWNNLKNLEVLRLARNKIDSLGTGIRQLKHLREIDVSDNRLTALPPELFILPDLEILNAANNNISRIPTIEPRRMKNRHTKCVFDLSENQITRFPQHLIHGAERLDLSGNDIRRIPLDALMQLQESGLVELNLSNNQLVDPPQAVCDGGVSVLLQHMEETRISRKVYYGLKVLVFGPPSSGKTSLVWSMIDEESRLTNDDEETSGVELYEMSRNVHLPQLNQNEERNLLMNVWDFSWKRNDLVLHRHFVKKPALILFVYDVSRVSVPSFAAELGSSLNWLLTCIGDLTLIPVGSRRDLVKKELDDDNLAHQVNEIIEQHMKKRLDRIRAEMDEIEARPHLSSAMTEQLKIYRKLVNADITLYPTIIVSSKTMSGVDTLLKKIEEVVVSESKFPNTMKPVPGMWIEVEKYLQDKCSDLQVPLVEGEALKNEVGKHFGMKHLIHDIFQYLSDNGKILSIRSFVAQRELIILKPTWFLDIARAIFRDKFDFENDCQLEQTLKAFRLSQDQFAAILSRMSSDGTLERTYLQCVWESVLPHKNSDKYDSCEAMLLSILMDYFEIGFAPAQKTAIEKPVPAKSNDETAPTPTDQARTVSTPSEKTRKKGKRKVKRSSSAQKTAAAAAAVAKKFEGQNQLASDDDTHHTTTDNNNQNVDGDSTAITTHAVELRFLYSPLLFGNEMPTNFRESYARFVGNVGIAAVFSFPYYHPPGIFETMVVRALNGKHTFILDYHWEDGIYAHCSDIAARFCLTRLVHDNGVACFRVEVRHNTSTEMDDVKELWRIILAYLRDVEVLLQSYPGLYVERYIECPKCGSLSFSGEWQTPKELQALTSKLCEDCGAEIPTSLLIQTKEKKKIEEFLRLRLQEKARKRSTVELPNVNEAAKENGSQSPIPSDVDE